MKKAFFGFSALLLVLATSCGFAESPSDESTGVDIPGTDAWHDEGGPDYGHDVGRPDEGGKDLNDHGGVDLFVPDETEPVDDGTPDVVEDLNPVDDGQPVDAGEDASGPRGRITVIPYLIDFGYVPLGGRSTVPITVRNDGDAALRLDKFTTTGPTSIMLDVGFEPQVSGSKTTYVVDPAKNLKPGAEFKGSVIFLPTVATEAYSEIRVFSSDSDYPDGYLVHAMGNKTRPDVDLNPYEMDFGAAVIGSPLTWNFVITSNGGMNVKVKSVYADAAAAAAGFRVEFPEAEPTVSNPVTLAPLQTLTVRVVYDPTQPSPVDSIGKPIPESGQIVVSGDMFTGNEFVRVYGFAVEGACTRPIVELLNESSEYGDGCPVDELDAETKNTRICRTDDGYEVPTGTLLKLSGAQSFSPFGAVESWAWSATQPSDNGGVFIPGSGEVNPTFMVGAGVNETTPEYELFLDVADGQGHTACTPGSLKIVTRTEVKADVILSWTPVTPFTPVPPYTGPDVDLHFTHPKAGDDGNEPDLDSDGIPDDWFDLPWDCFWYYPSPAKDLWGEALPWTNDLVRLRNDSDDGQEPEVLSMGLECPNGRKFKVGAYFFDDHGYGDVMATVQIFVKGELKYTATRQLQSLDMWYVGDLQCVTSGLEKTGTFISTSAKLTHNYVNDDFGNP